MDAPGGAGGRQEVWLAREQVEAGSGRELLKAFLKRLRE